MHHERYFTLFLTDMNGRTLLERFAVLSVLLSVSLSTVAQSTKTKWDSLNTAGIAMRSVGPAFMTGRISDIAIDPADENHYLVGVASGGVWETKNAGITFQPIFDKQKVYSIGCITMDANSGHIWVGSGENVGGRHISYGDGVYLSKNGGKSWENMGLKESEHISKILVHPTNPDIVWVASQGPLWNSGGERGVYMTTDGGKKWKRTLGDTDWMGATDLLIDPRDPSLLYAATWQRHRTVAAYLGGGPKTAIYKSTNGGEDWEQLKTGLPSGNMGKIGLAISPQNPDVVYAAIELDLKKGGFYKSENRGGSWTKMSDMISGGTGPHYYQEIYASPHQFDRVYFANNYLKVTNDGGKTFENVGKKHKHVDNHTVVFRASDPDYLMVGTDGGVYESFDLAEEWRHMGNMPITQFYKLAVDDAEPFYNIYGGTQDNNTQGGASRTDKQSGITNADWQIVLGGDGHQPATEPGNPDIVYAQSQQGYFTRLDMASGERVAIRPQPGAGEGFERYNWDAPILVSAHDPKRVYVASHRLWRSDNRGDSWDTLSPDLTRDEERLSLPIMGKQQSYTNPWDLYAMSTYNTITSIGESPKNENLLYIGTDDGLIQVSEDGGKNWEVTDVKSLPGAPKRAYVNDIKADLHDENTVYIALDNHKTGDYAPYLYVSKNKGKSWKCITGNLPDNHYIWRIVQDHVKPELLFIGTEFGLFFSPNAGETWKQLKTGLPTISFRDLAIQKRENDLVAASFGRSFYILDDYSFLREVDEELLDEEAKLFPLRAADLYMPKADGRQEGGSLGGQHFVGKNPAYGAVFTYYLKEAQETKVALRTKEEKELTKNERDIPFLGWEELEAEQNENMEQHWLVIKDSRDKVVRSFKVASGEGFHREAWNLRYSSAYEIGENEKDNGNKSDGFLAPAGTYSATLYRRMDGEASPLDEPIVFEVESLYKSTLVGKSKEEKDAFEKEYIATVDQRGDLMRTYREQKRKVETLRVAAQRLPASFGEVDADLLQMQDAILAMDKMLYGNKAKAAIGEKDMPSLNDRVWAAAGALYGSIYGPTGNAKASLAIAKSMLTDIEQQVAILDTQIILAYQKLIQLGAPEIRGME